MFTDRQVSRLEKDLRHDDSKVRAQGLRRMARLPRDALLAYVIERPWVPLVLGTLLALEAGDPVATGNLEEVALARVAAALSGRSVARRRAAHKALIHGNVSLASILPALERCTRDRRRDVRRRAADVLGWGAPGQTVPTADVSHVESQLRDPVLRELGFSSAAGMIRRLLEALAAAGAHAGTRQSLAGAVHTGLAPLEDVIDQLTRALGDDDARLRAQAAGALGATKAADGRAVRALIRVLGDADERASGQACFALLRLGGALAVAADRLEPHLGNPLPHVRANAVRLLPVVWATPAARRDALARALADPSVDVQVVATETLAKVGEEVRAELLAILQARLDDRASPLRLRVASAHTLAHFTGTGERPIAVLIESLRAADPSVRRAAASALGCLGGRAAQAVPALLTAARDRRECNARYAALWALRDLGPKARPAAGGLRGLLEDPDPRVRRFAAEALARLGVVRDSC